MDRSHCALDTGADLFVASCLFVLASLDSAQARRDSREAHRDCRYTGGDCEADRESPRQQGKVLDEQTKIMDEQFKFQRTIELKAERVQVFDALMRLHVSFKALLSTLSEVQLSNYTQAMQDRVRSDWRRMQEDLLPCTKAIHTSIHMSPQERAYFMGYVQGVAGLTESSDIRKAIQNVNALEAKYKDFAGKMFAAAKTPVSS